jgi:hypothetical protein
VSAGAASASMYSAATAAVNFWLNRANNSGPLVQLVIGW